MSIGEFQRAFAALISSPELCIRARADIDNTLGEFSLTSRELRRLHDMVCSDGMSVNCTLYRVNRLIPIYSVLPHTCRLLGKYLGPELDAFTSASRHSTLQYRWEAWRFGNWIQDKIELGLLPGGPVEDAIRFELAVFDARTNPAGSQGQQRTVSLRYAPEELLDRKVDPDSLRPLLHEVVIVVG